LGYIVKLVYCFNHGLARRHKGSEKQSSGLKCAKHLVYRRKYMHSCHGSQFSKW